MLQWMNKKIGKTSKFECRGSLSKHTTSTEGTKIQVSPGSTELLPIVANLMSLSGSQLEGLTKALFLSRFRQNLLCGAHHQVFKFQFHSSF